ncbi:Na/Pi cotransporter family protein [Magnetofaba australis]|uniref:Putative phosphate:Na+ symporter n=1 Tax=Magnetofaba australis IT-1 TaxID=1434232 RepID=A0A1Y2K1I5_9PROT|nr:Na/Pi symporter [Magnetofaba australis]OSM01842.1 putative phosphate:Na+ symporter [Magnetofaba australis IT-1]
MLKRILLPTIFFLLAYGFWISPNFKEISAGVSIFLFGMLFLEEGFKAFTGGVLEKLLQRTTDRLWKSLGFGVITTTIMQSSSLVSVITISFMSAGLISLAAGIGIIFGANIGTTTGAWLVAGFGLKVKISAYAMPMLVFGVILVFQRSKKLRGVGQVLAGLGFLFLGIHHMKEGFEAFRETINLAEFAMQGFAGLLVYCAIGVAATVVMQSSHATLVLIITALSVNQITYENALALAIGANIGTTITAIIGAMSANYQGKRLAGAHLLFNVFTGLVAILFIAQFKDAVEWISNHVGISADDYALKLAVFHTIFNAVGVALMSPLVGRLVTLLERVIKQPATERVEAQFLNEAVYEFPETYVESVRNEAMHLYDNASEMIAHGLSVHRHHMVEDDEEALEERLRASREVIEFDLDAIYLAKVKTLHAAIIEFTSKAQQHEMPRDVVEQVYEVRRACALIVQCVKDVKHLRKNMMRYIVSSNDDIRNEYNEIRIQIMLLLKKINELRDGVGELGDVLSLDDYKAYMEEGNAIVTGALDQMIRDGRVSAQMGSSLMNDLGYARDVVWNLAEMGEVLFGSKNASDRAAEALLALDDDDMADMEGAHSAPK